MSKVKDSELKGPTDSLDHLCWDPKHTDLIAAASGDKTVHLWDAHSAKCSQQVELSGENITYKPDGTHIAVGNRDDELTILDGRKFKPIHKCKFNYEVNEMAWNMTGDIFFLTTGNDPSTKFHVGLAMNSLEWNPSTTYLHMLKMIAQVSG